MSTLLLPDALWNLIQPLLQPATVRPKGGRPRLSDRACLTGILFVLRSADTLGDAALKNSAAVGA
jgi:transposase